MNNLIIILIAILTLSLVLNFYLLFNLNNIKKEFTKLYIENAVMQEYIDIAKSNKNSDISDEYVDKESFIKFLSDSRDWAFTYIEDVQNELKNFFDTLDPDLNYFDEYGVIGSAYPHYDAMIRINNAYKKLKKIMPKEEEIK